METWRGGEGKSPFLFTDEESRMTREEESYVSETRGTRTSCSATAESSRRMVEGGRWLTLPFSFLTHFFLCFFPPDASTMDEVTKSPNKKSDNKLHWIRMSRWMDDSRRVDGSSVNEHYFVMMLRHGSEISNQIMNVHHFTKQSFNQSQWCHDLLVRIGVKPFSIAVHKPSLTD